MFELVLLVLHCVYWPLALPHFVRQTESDLKVKHGLWIFLVGAGGFEPPTSSLSEKRSNQLSYAPIISMEKREKYMMFTLGWSR